MLTDLSKQLRTYPWNDLPELPRYKLDENQQIVIEDIIEEHSSEAPMPEREDVEEKIENEE